MEGGRGLSPDERPFHHLTDYHDLEGKPVPVLAEGRVLTPNDHLPKDSPVKGCNCVWCRATRGPVGL